MKKKILIIALIILLCFLFLFLYFKLNKKNNKTIETYGNVEIRQVDLSFQVEGRIKEVFVEEGDVVKKGDLLATLDNRDYLAKYEKINALTKSLEAQKREDLSKYQRNLPLCFDGTISKQDCETLLNKKNISISKFDESVADLKFQKNQLEYTRLFSPQDGIITTRAQEKGAYVGANQIIYVMSLNKPIWIRTYIKETDLGNVKYGQKACIYTDSIDIKTKKKKSYQGFVGYISPVAEFTPKTVQTQELRVDLMYRTRVYIDETDEFLRQGMPVTVRIWRDGVDDEKCS